MSNVQTGADRTPHDLSHFLFSCGQIGRLKTLSFTPVLPGDSFEMEAVGALRLSPLRRGLVLDSQVDICSFYVPFRHAYGEDWMNFLQLGLAGGVLPTTPTTVDPGCTGFLATYPSNENTVPTWLFHAYHSVYNNYFKPPWRADYSPAIAAMATDEMVNGYACCHLKNIWTAPLPPGTDQVADIDVSGGTLDIMDLNAAYGRLHTEQERDFFMQRYRDVVEGFGGSTNYDVDQRPHMLMRTKFWASGYDVDGTDQTSLGQFSGRVQQNYSHKVPRFFVPEHGVIITVGLVRFPAIHHYETHYLVGRGSNVGYPEIAGDPAIVGNQAPLTVGLNEIFYGEASLDTMVMAPSQWYRTHPSRVDDTYSQLQGFPFLKSIGSSGTINERLTLIVPERYDDSFQSMQLFHWNTQARINVNVLRALPFARDAIMTAG